MKRILTAVSVAVLTFAFTGLAGAATYQHKFTGASKCKVCHMAEKKGNQYGVWSGSSHAKAFTVLATDEAKAVAKKAGVADPQTDKGCLSCHVTGFDAPAEMKGPKYAQEEGVTCESCHGPGEDYSPLKVMKDKAAAVAAGLKVPDEKTCKQCHNEKSPTYKPFNYATFWAKIKHDNPLTQ
ncbi:cytochrome c family protein [bacterium]|nr:cytochrome c family protein [bacterium]